MLSKLRWLKRKKQSSMLAMPIQMKGNPKRFLAPLLNGWRSVKNKEAGVKQTNREQLE